jgi:hypothetical protein
VGKSVSGLSPASCAESFVNLVVQAAHAGLGLRPLPESPEFGADEAVVIWTTA